MKWFTTHAIPHFGVLAKQAGLNAGKGEIGGVAF
jgi:hypothetical protein